jgi:hypothetical protein
MEYTIDISNNYVNQVLYGLYISTEQFPAKRQVARAHRFFASCVSLLRNYTFNLSKKDRTFQKRFYYSNEFRYGYSKEHINIDMQKALNLNERSQAYIDEIKLCAEKLFELDHGEFNY